jgi:hypothetical protein
MTQFGFQFSNWSNLQPLWTLLHSSVSDNKENPSKCYQVVVNITQRSHKDHQCWISTTWNEQIALHMFKQLIVALLKHPIDHELSFLFVLFISEAQSRYFTNFPCTTSLLEHMEICKSYVPLGEKGQICWSHVPGCELLQLPHQLPLVC